MPFLVLLVLTLACLQGRWPAPPAWLGLWGSLAATWLGAAGLAASAAWTAERLCRQIYREPGQRATWLASYARLKRYHVLVLIACYLVGLYLAGWGWTARDLLSLSDRLLPGVELLILSPFLVVLVLFWVAFYRVDRAIHLTASGGEGAAFPSCAAYVALQARHNLMLALPPLLLVVLQQTILSLFPALQHDGRLLPVVAFCLLGGVFVGIPWLLRLFLGLKPLPDCPLRERLLATARRLKFRFNDILLWETGGTIANAMVTGPLPFLRYVVLTDRLVEEMSPDEVEAVFGHEVGHIKHHHMVFYFGFLMISLVVVASVWDALGYLFDLEPVQALLVRVLPDWQEWKDTYEVLTLLPLLALVGGYIFVVFGFLSRRCERQADIYGCRTVSTPVFIEALEKVARLNGISRDRPGWLSSWQHSTIALRIDFLERMTTDPGLEPRFQRRVGLVKWGMLLGLGAVLGLLVIVLGSERVWSILQNL